MDATEKIDDIGWCILAALQEDARMNFAELGRRVGLSAPAVAERVRRLEERGIVTGYRATVDRTKLGYGLTAFIRLRIPAETHKRLDALAREMPEILECHHVTGDDAFVLKAIARSIAHLDRIILRLAPFGATTSSVVLSTRIEDKPVARPEAAPPA